MAESADAIIIGGGLAGLVAACELAGRGKRRHPRPGRRAKPRRAGLLVVRRAVPGGYARAAPARRFRDSLDLALQDWMGSARFDRDEEPIRGAGRKPMSSSPPARSGLAACAGHALVSGGRLGRARRALARWPRQFGAALSRHLGHRARRCRAVRARVRAGVAERARRAASSATASTRIVTRNGARQRCGRRGARYRPTSRAARRAAAMSPANSSCARGR